jgi:putative holliday junction resolvase
MRSAAINGTKSETILAFDYGAKRVGIAVGESALRSAHALSTLTVPAAQLLDAVGKVVEEWKPARFVVGRPAHEDGTPHEMTGRCERFARQLSARFRLPSSFVDERYTSIDAEATLRAQGVRRDNFRGQSDSLAAAYILERYFESLT